MGAIASSIGGWLKAGLDLAATCFKWIWEKVCSLFSKVCDAARSLFGRLEIWCIYHRERSYVTTEPGRVEVGRSEIHCGANIGGNPTGTRADPMPKDPAQREVKPTKTIEEECDIMINALQKVKSIKQKNEHHLNMEKTSQELKDFYNSKDGRDLFKILDNQATINPSLA